MKKLLLLLLAMPIFALGMEEEKKDVKDMEATVEIMACQLRAALQLTIDDFATPETKERAKKTIERIKHSPYYPMVKKKTMKPVTLEEIYPKTPRLVRRKSSLASSIYLSKED